MEEYVLFKIRKALVIMITILSIFLSACSEPIFVNPDIPMKIIKEQITPIFVYLQWIGTTNTILTINQDASSKAINFVQENLDDFKDKLNTEISTTSSNSKMIKKSYELWGFKDIDEVKKLKVGKCFRIYSIKSDNLDENKDLTTSLAPTNSYEVFLNLNNKPRMSVIVTLNKDNKLKIVEYGGLGKQLPKALEKADELTKMFSVGNQYYLLKKEKEKEKILPAATFENDINELESKDFAKRYNDYIKMNKNLLNNEIEKEGLKHFKDTLQ